MPGTRVFCVNEVQLVAPARPELDTGASMPRMRRSHPCRVRSRYGRIVFISQELLPAAASAATPIKIAAADTMGGMTMRHGMPIGRMGADGNPYLGAPHLEAASSLVAAGGAPQHFSIVAALRHLAGNKTANAELLKLTRQYGPGKIESFVKVQNFAVDEAVRDAVTAGIAFPAPTLKGKQLAVAITKLGLQNGTYYEGVMLDHLVSNEIHVAVMKAIDAQYGTKADANYHRIADQAHYDLARALGAKSVELAAYH